MSVTKVSAELNKELRAASKPLKRKKGTILFEVGAPPQGAYLVRKGRVRLRLDGATGTYPPRTLGPGSMVGLPATVSGEPYSLTAELVQDSELAFISRRELIKLLKHNPAAALQILQILSEEIYQMRNTAKWAVLSRHETVQ